MRDRSTRSRTRWVVFTALLSSALMLMGPAAAHGEATFNFSSRGYGHGLGMSQYGAKGFAEHGYKYDYILRYYYGDGGRDANTKVVTWPAAEPTRDVILDGAASSANAGYTRSFWTLRPGHAGTTLSVHVPATGVTHVAPDGWSTFTASGGAIIWKKPDGTSISLGPSITVWGSGGNPQLTQVQEGTGMYNLTHVRFRGELRLTAKTDALKLVNRVSMRDYLYGVVPRESPSGWHMEALKAQAVAARGYSWSSPRTELYTTTADQVYGGHSRGDDRAKTTPHETARTNAAVDATPGRVVTYNGTMIRTYFMSTSGGHTESSENVWSAAHPYLRGVPDPFELGAGSPAHTWQTKQMTASQLRSNLASQGVAPQLLPGIIAGVRVVERGASGRVMKVELTSNTGARTYLQGSADMDRFKRALGFKYPDRWIYVNPKTARIAGIDRYATALRAAQRGGAGAGVVIIASGTAPADALAASSLAGATAAAAGPLAYTPVLLTPGDQLDGRVRDWIATSGATRVYIVGGLGVVSSDVERQLRATGRVTNVVRLAGDDRYGTARKIAIEVKRLNPSVNRAIVVNGIDFADAVAASALAFDKGVPIIPVRPGSVPAESSAALREVGAASTLVVGGKGAVSDAVLGFLPKPTRIAAGIDRYESAKLLAEYLRDKEGFSFASTYVSSGVSLVDALSVGPLAGYHKNPMLFAREYDLPARTREVVASTVSRIWVVGGEGALSGWVEGQMNEACE